MGTLENTFAAIKELAESTPEDQGKFTKIAGNAINNAAKCDKQRYEIVRWLAWAARLEMEAVNPNSDNYQLAIKRSEFYQSIYDSVEMFSGTGLEPPFLNEAIQKMFGKSTKELNL